MRLFPKPFHLSHSLHMSNHPFSDPITMPPLRVTVSVLAALALGIGLSACSDEAEVPAVDAPAALESQPEDEPADFPVSLYYSEDAGPVEGASLRSSRCQTEWTPPRLATRTLPLLRRKRFFVGTWATTSPLAWISPPIPRCSSLSIGMLRARSRHCAGRMGGTYSMRHLRRKLLPSSGCFLFRSPWLRFG